MAIPIACCCLSVTTVSKSCNGIQKRQKLCMLTSKYIIYPCFCHYDNTKVILVHIFLHINYRDNMMKNDIFTRGKNIAFYIFQLSHTNQVTDGDLQMMTLGRCMIVQRQIRPVLCLVHGSTKARDPAQMSRVRYQQSQMNTHWSKNVIDSRIYIFNYSTNKSPSSRFRPLYS